MSNGKIEPQDAMNSYYFCVSLLFLDGRFHGKVEDGSPEWPPSPLRLFQAIVNANASKLDEPAIQEALCWLEEQPAPLIITPPVRTGRGYVLSVPNNAMDIVARAWLRGNYFGKGDSNPATHRTMKHVCPVCLPDGGKVFYLWRLPERAPGQILERVSQLAKSLFRVGWGSDLAVCDARVMSGEHVSSLPGERWRPDAATGGMILRVPCQGTLGELRRHHKEFLGRLASGLFIPVSPLARFVNVGYRTMADVSARPYAVFELRTEQNKFFAYSQQKMIHVAGMVRHLAIRTMKKLPPREIDAPATWIDQYVAGHCRNSDSSHRQFSYLPLPSIGHRHADQGVRRVMVSAPVGDQKLLEHLARTLAGQVLEPLRGDEFGGQSPPVLVRRYRDKVVACYVRPSKSWATVTPVVLPGHNDRKFTKTVRLVEKALYQSGIEHPCTFKWQNIAWWPRSLPAKKFDRNGKPVGYLLPKYLQRFSLVHLRINFDREFEMPGPMAIGAGRHCGLGLLAGIDNLT